MVGGEGDENVNVKNQRGVVWKTNRKEEDLKSPFNGWLKAYQVAIDLREAILSAQGIQSRIQKI